MGGCSGARMISASPAGRNALLYLYPPYSCASRDRAPAVRLLGHGLPDPPRELVRTAAHFGGIAALDHHANHRFGA